MPISRLQLAAALVEYDNDSELASPSVHAEVRDHRQSAIFLPFEKAREEHRRQQILAQPPPSLPSPLEVVRPLPEPPRQEDQTWRKSTLAEFSLSGPGRRTNPTPDRLGQGDYGQEQLEDQEDEEDLADVDVARWGLPSHLVAEEQKRPLSRPESTRRSSVAHPVPRPVDTPPGHTRVKSVHVSDVLDDTALHRQVMAETQAKLEGEHRRALSYDRYSVHHALVESERSKRLADRPATSTGMQDRHKPERTRTISDPMMLPLPRSPISPAGPRPMSSLSRGWTSPPPGAMDEEEHLEEPESSPNPFALPAPPPELGSRFDPKVLQRQRQSSTDSTPMGGFGSSAERDHRRRDSGRMSARTPTIGYFDNPPHSATNSSHPPDSAGLPYLHSPGDQQPPLKSPAQVYEDIPTPEQYGRPLMPKRYSTSARLQVDRATLLRPRTLIMPAPLADQHPPAVREPKLPEGYTLGEKPIPFEARTHGSRPGMPLSLSQRTFRSSLMVGGVREDDWVGGSEVEGEVGVQNRELDEGAIARKPGKLYGKSLMDQLEARKAMLKSRQRVFTGDSRPAMMARTTMYDLPTVSIAPTSPQLDSAERPHSMHPAPRGPLLAFDSNGDIHSTPPGLGPGTADYHRHSLGPGDMQVHGRMSKSKSVFGVDQLWEKEMAKLKLIQEEERRAAETRQAVEEAKRLAEEEKKMRKRKGKGKMSIVVPPEDPRPVEEVLGISPIKRADELPPALEFEPEQAPRPPTPPDDDEGEEPSASDQSESGRATPAEESTAPVVEPEPASDSDSDEDVPLSKLAPPTRNSAKLSNLNPARQSAIAPDSDSDSDEDIPLSKLSIKSPARSSNSPHTRPLGSLGLTLPKLSPLSADEPDEDEDEDDLPLAVRQAKARGLKPITKADIIEDDLPLGYKHAEKALQQMAERSRSSQASWDGRPPAQSQPQPFGGMGMGVPGWDGNPHQSFVPPMGYPYGGGMGYPSMPNLGMQMNPYMQGMHPGMMGMGAGMDGAGAFLAPGPSGQNPVRAIDNWRKDVALAPAPDTGSGSGSADRRSVAGSVV